MKAPMHELKLDQTNEEHRLRSINRQGHRFSFGEMLTRAARNFPDVLAVSDTHTDRTYAELEDRAHRLSSALRSRGVSEGSRVCILALNRTEFVETFYACAKLGAILVPINHRLAPDEISHILRDADPVLSVSQYSLLPKLLAAAKEDERAVPILVFDAFTHNDASDSAELESFEAALYGEWDASEDADVAETSPLLILYTSGTTGRPKGVVQSHLAFALNGLHRAQAQQLQTAQETIYVGLQLFHSGALATLAIAPSIGASFVMSGNESPSASDVLGILERYHVTMCSLVPTQWQAVCDLDAVGERKLSLKRISWGAASANTELLSRMRDVLGEIPIASMYGQTETCGVAFIIDGQEAADHPGAVGRPLPHFEVRLVDGNMHDVPDNEVGELVYRGPSVMDEYWDNPDGTESAFAGGWFHSGDLLRRDETGRYWLVDRVKDLIVSGGENIYPAEIERVLITHPKVADVAVAGVPHPRWGETPAAFVIPVRSADPPTLDELSSLCQQHLASYKKPTSLVIVESFPRNASGKVLRRELRLALARRD